MNKEKFVPKLRFREFVNDEEWEVKPFNEVYSFKITNSFSRDKLNYTKGTVKNIHYGDIHTKFSTLFDITKEIVPFITSDNTIDKTDKDNYCTKGDIIFADASEDLDDVGKSIEIVNLNDEKLIAGLHTFLARQIEPKFVIGFGGYLFKSNSIRNQIKKESQGAKVFGISKGRISEIKIYYPPNKEEQQKIASCLSSLDDLIIANRDKLEVLKDYKKGLMKNLFPQEGETVPKYRFKDFSKDGEWIEKKLTEVCEINPPHAVLPENFMYIDLESVDAGTLKRKRYTKLNEAPSRAQRLLKKGDIIFQTVRPYQQNNYYFLPEDDSTYVASTGYAQLRAYESALFLYQYLHSQIFLKKVLTKCTGSNYPVINSSDLAKILILIPKNIKEQQQIASCLSALDELIKAQSEKIDQLQLHKKALMQGLFPESQ